MSANTKIEWADHTFNPWEGCQKVGPGCDHCYAEARNARFAGGQAINWGPGAPRRRTSEANWHQPLKWNLQAARLGIRYRVFCASLADVFDNEVPPEWRADLFALIARTPHLDWLILTKRIGNVSKFYAEMKQLADEEEMSIPSYLLAMHDQSDYWEKQGGVFPAWPLPNVWLGATIVNQAEADRDIPKLLAVPAAKRFLSMEPLLGQVDITPFLWGKNEAIDTICQNCPRNADCECGYHTRKAMKMAAIDWVIVGGESGPGARPMHPDWARSLRDQCQAAGVPFLFKQWGEWAPVSGVCSRENSAFADTKSPYIWREKPLGQSVIRLGRIGKKAAGRLLDGRIWDEVPA